jgi:hypothetical protein
MYKHWLYRYKHGTFYLIATLVKHSKFQQFIRYNQIE